MVKKDDYTQHISAQFNTELEDIRSNFLAMGGMVEKQVVDAITSLLDADGRRKSAGGGQADQPDGAPD